MRTIFDDTERAELLRRIGNLTAARERLWGTMNAAQALCHCSRALETATGDQPRTQAFLGKILTPFIRKSVFSETPFKRNGPTDPDFVVKDECDFDAERSRLIELVERFAAAGPEPASRCPHAFFGKMSGEEWGILMHKHITTTSASSARER